MEEPKRFLRAPGLCGAGQTGLEVCSGLTTDRKKAQEAQWVAFDPVPGAITINIGDSLQYWSDGALKSTYHRVRCPTAEDYAVSPPLSLPPLCSSSACDACWTLD